MAASQPQTSTTAHIQNQTNSQPQVITLQQLQSFLPQQMGTISTDGAQVSAASATNATPVKTFVANPQMPQQQILNLQNLQGIPHQFVQVRGYYDFRLQELPYLDCFFFVRVVNSFKILEMVCCL